MNILIPHNWLKEHLETQALPEKIQNCLSLCGPSVERLINVNGQPVYDIEVTTNRVDMMSVRGIAREATAILPEFDIKARLIPLHLNELKSKVSLDITINNNPKLCHRILAVKLENIKVEPSPSWIQKRLIEVGQRPLNNIIDITNYVMWEVGHPIHVFDYDRLTQKTIIVREAKKGEPLVTLDEKTHTLKGGEVIFDDGNGKIIDLPGIMGTKNTVVTDKTRNVLLWIESIDPVRIRNASMGLAIRSQAAILNEKNVDPELGKTAILKATEMYKEVANARVSSKLIDIYPKKQKVTSLILRQNLLDTYMGTELEASKVKRILRNLGCAVEQQKAGNGGRYKIIPPTWRVHDMTIPQDAIEEIARIYGYHNLPSVLMSGKIPTKGQGIPFDLEDTVKDYLSGWGLMEVYTYSLVSEKLAKLSGLTLTDHIRLTNPLTEEHVFLRRSIIPSHLEVIKTNPGYKEIGIFELAHVYKTRKNNHPREIPQLVITIQDSFKKAKGIIEMLLQRLRVEHQYLAKNGKIKMLHPQRTSMITSGDEIIGILGEVESTVLKKLELTSPITSVVLHANRLFSSARSHPTYQPLPKHPPIIEDFTFVLPEKTFAGEVLEEIESTSRLVESAIIKEKFQRNITFTVTFRHPSRSLKDEDVLPERKKIKKHLEKNFGARLVGKL